MQCPSAKCGSSNIENLAHYWQSLPAESTLRLKYAPPTQPEARVWMALVAVVLGVAVLASGEVVLGLAVAVAGLVGAAFIQGAVTRYRMAFGEWDAARICLACTRRF